MSKLEKALLVLVLTPATRKWLEKNDPKALRQALDALRLEGTAFDPSPEELTAIERPGEGEALVWANSEEHALRFFGIGDRPIRRVRGPETALEKARYDEGTSLYAVKVR